MAPRWMGWPEQGHVMHGARFRTHVVPIGDGLSHSNDPHTPCPCGPAPDERGVVVHRAQDGRPAFTPAAMRRQADDPDGLAERRWSQR